MKKIRFIKYSPFFLWEVGEEREVDGDSMSIDTLRKISDSIVVDGTEMSAEWLVKLGYAVWVEDEHEFKVPEKGVYHYRLSLIKDGGEETVSEWTAEEPLHKGDRPEDFKTDEEEKDWSEWIEEKKREFWRACGYEFGQTDKVKSPDVLELNRLIRHSLLYVLEEYCKEKDLVWSRYGSDNLYFVLDKRTKEPVADVDGVIEPLLDKLGEY